MTASGIFKSLSLYVLSSFLKVGTRNWTSGRRIDSATGCFMPRPGSVIMALERDPVSLASPLPVSSLRIARLPIVCGDGREAYAGSIAGEDFDRDSLLRTGFFVFT